MKRISFLIGFFAAGRLVLHALGIFVLLAGLAACGAEPYSPVPTATTAPTNTPEAVPTETQPASPTASPIATVGIASPTAPTKAMATVEAFKGLGKLAFVNQDLLFVLDGGEGQLYQLTMTGKAQQPAWSYDGAWIAYLGSGSANPDMNTVWVSRSDGSEKQEFKGFTGFSWSPVGSELALISDEVDKSGVWLAAPGNNPRQFADSKQPVGTPLWSPDGKTLAYVTTLPFQNPESRSDAIYTIPVTGGAATQLFVAQFDGIRLVAWWPDSQGMLFMRQPAHSESLAVDGLPLESLDLQADSTRIIANAVVHFGWIAESKDGQRLALVQGAGREAWKSKTIKTCTILSSVCQVLPQPGQTVSLDPSWNPDGTQLAFVRAKTPAQSPNNAATLQAWEQTRTLWVAKPDGSEAREIKAAGTGIQAPVWSGDGKQVVYVRPDGLWLIDTAKATAPVQLSKTLTGQNDEASGFYGYTDWPSKLSWYR